MPEAIPGEVLVMGAGTIGCFIGGSLAAAGVPVTFVGRPRVLEKLARHGLTLTDIDGAKRTLPADSLRLCGQVPAGAKPALVLLCVKSGATAEAAGELAFSLPAGTAVISLQNGISNCAAAAQTGPSLNVRAGMVPYNVAEIGPGAFHRGTGGRLAAEDDAVLRPWVPVFERAGVPLDLHADLLPVQWGKLMLNLNNPVNALSGLPLREELMQRGYRRCFASLIDEALGVLKVAGIAPAQVAAVPAHRLAGLLRLPDWIFRIVAARMLRIDAKARSSMADDLALGRRTEIDALSGEVVRLAREHGLSAPRNSRMVSLLEAWPQQPKRWTARQLQDALGL
ncbi:MULTISPECIES: 2-dehydropantoate 2-reductase [Variovorax]|uniref:2-dehydropantoate 2-reductase n=1 Tax=Variovorax TaxID=34072 RepID=UPI000375B3C0|nr:MULTISPECIES: 2-dehydropantoate 2-reductase [Variovorax]MBB3638087.1 2-dehydropantoate 2-reductase [Variovorax sp. BK613]MDR6518569.1 2-dehydropantoate 2-reductase [Variovorax paradoxus]